MPNIQVSDVDDETLFFAEVGFQEGDFQPGLDGLVAGYKNESVRTVFDPNQGTLFMIGEASVDEYTKLLQSIAYQFAANDSIQPFESKTVYFVTSDGKAESERKFREIVFSENLDLDIPTVFTPNDDNANDTWRIGSGDGSDVNAQVVVRVFNKRGAVVYEAYNLEKEWDGKLNGQVLPSDTYFYTIQFNVASINREYSGTVTILH
jgi:gliding motility-associated-like protein